MSSYRKFYATLPALALAVGLAGSAQAATIGSWGFESYAADYAAGSYINEALPVAGVSVGNMTPANANTSTKVRDGGESKLYGGSSSSAGVPGWSDKIFDLKLATDSSSAAAQIAGDGYFTFTVTATGADQVDLTLLSIFAGANKTGLGHDSTLQVDVDTDGDTVFDDTYSFANLNKVGSNNPGDQVDLVLSSTINPGDTGTIRVLAFNDTAGNPLSAGKLRFDDLTVDADLVPFVAPPTLTVDRDTGNMTLTTGADIDILGYSITSGAGTLDQSGWTTIAGNYDATPLNGGTGDGSVDIDDNWTVLLGSGGNTDLSEAEFAGGNGGTISSTGSVDFGNAWLEYWDEDVEMELLLNDGSGTRLQIDVDFINGAGATPDKGDFDFDGDIDADDYSTFLAGLHTDVSTLSVIEAYVLGDMDEDLAIGHADFLAFRTAFNNANGAGSFAAMAAAVPEPGSLFLLAFGSLLLLGRGKRN